MHRSTVVAGVLVLAAAASSRGVEPDGSQLYRERCAACHGADGRGDGPAAVALNPPPRNFRSTAFWQSADPASLHETIEHGRPGTLMQAFGGVLSDAEIDAVIRHLNTFRPGGDHAHGDHGQASDAGAGQDPTGGGDRP